MSCKRMESRLVAYMDGRASNSDRRAVESHLEQCAACRVRVEGFEGVWSVLNEMPVREPSPAFEARLRARLAAEPQTYGLLGWPRGNIARASPGSGGNIAGCILDLAVVAACFGQPRLLRRPQRGRFPYDPGFAGTGKLRRAHEF